MGTLSSSLGGETTMFRYLAIACLAAVAVGEPEAKADVDPALLYGGYGYGLGYGYAGPGYVYAGLRHHGYGYGLPELGFGPFYGKREAEAPSGRRVGAAVEVPDENAGSAIDFTNAKPRP